MPRAQVKGQVGMDERIVEDADLEAALEAREKDREVMGVARGKLKQSHEVAVALVDKLGLEDGSVVRVGRFRIAKQMIAAHEVEFETAESSRVSIRATE
jgi:hypothetical protein